MRSRRHFLTLAVATGVFAIPVLAKAGERPAAIIYKTPQCGCCEGYADYLRQNGFSVTVVPTHDLNPMKREFGVPKGFEGCHTMLIDQYVVEGHVPVATVDKLLAEKPKIKGISLPGMPLGSPGMSGVKQAPFEIYQFGEGPPKVYAVE